MQSRIFVLFLLLISFFIVAWGQPAISSTLSICAGAFGFALFWIALFKLDLKAKNRFWLGCFWFMGVQLVQLSWALSHPFNYIYPLWILCSLMVGAQFGLLCWWLDNKRLEQPFGLASAAGLWVLLEWSRLFWLSGVSWNPVGLTLSGSLLSLQTASLLGVYGMSFWVIWSNLWLARSFFHLKSLAIAIPMVLLPYAFGFAHLAWHEPLFEASKKDLEPINAILVQPATQVEETMGLRDPQSTLIFTLRKWQQVFLLLKGYEKREVDLIVLPEYLVPYGTYYPVFPFESVKKEFTQIFGTDVSMPKFEPHLAASLEVFSGGKIWMVNNAYMAQMISNLFDANVVIGLEDSDETVLHQTSHYTCAITFYPEEAVIDRYAKRVLVPLGEYIPFDFCRKIAANYGVFGSFTPGSEAKVINGKVCPFGLSVCYEETYGNIMRDNRLLGAELLVNLTNDFWYPRSLLPQQHFDHSRLRAVEMGIPLARAANNGVTAAVDSLGRLIAKVEPLEGGKHPEEHAEALFVSIPRYHYTTIYTYVGDLPLIGASFALILIPFFFRRKKLEDK